MNRSHDSIEITETTDLTEVAAFYEEVGYGVGCDAGDRILVARDGPTIVAAVRLCEEGDVLVLRGMYVAAKRRGQGVGAMLLAAAEAAIGSIECWCVPYTRLVRFYSTIGFCVEADETAPTFLAKRKARYSASGQDVTLMRRSAVAGFKSAERQER